MPRFVLKKLPTNYKPIFKPTGHLYSFLSNPQIMNLNLLPLLESPSNASSLASNPSLLLFSLINLHLCVPTNTITTPIHPAQTNEPLIYSGPSSPGYNLVPNSGPHCPNNCNIASPAPLDDSVSALFPFQVIVNETIEKMVPADNMIPR